MALRSRRFLHQRITAGSLRKTVHSSSIRSVKRIRWPAGCPVATPQGTPAIYGTNFHTAYMPVVAEGCVGTISCESGQSVLGAAAACDIGNGGCRTGAGVSQKDPVDPSQVVLDTTKHYYISVLPGDAMDPGHAMGGAQLAATCTPVAPATTCTPNVRKCEYHCRA